MEKSELFEGISAAERDKLLVCFKAESAEYQNGEIICDFSCRRGLIGILSRGRAFTSRIDAGGNRTILEMLPEGSIFGETIAFAPGGDDVAVIAAASAAVTFIEYNHITKRCSNACAYHSRLVENMLKLISEKSMRLSERVEILSRRTIREKALAYFRGLTLKRGGGFVKLPFSVTTLSEYLCVDRSALSRELKKLKQEGEIELSGGMLRLPKP